MKDISDTGDLYSEIGRDGKILVLAGYIPAQCAPLHRVLLNYSSILYMCHGPWFLK